MKLCFYQLEFMILLNVNDLLTIWSLKKCFTPRPCKSDHMIQCYSNFLGSCVRNAENLSSLFVGPFRWLWMNSPWLNIIVPFDILLQASPLYTCLLNGLRAWSVIKLLIVRALNEKIVNFKYQIRNLRGWTLESSSSLKWVWTIPRFDLELVETCIFESLTWV